MGDQTESIFNRTAFGADLRPVKVDIRREKMEGGVQDGSKDATVDRPEHNLAPISTGAVLYLCLVSNIYCKNMYKYIQFPLTNAVSFRATQ